METFLAILMILFGASVALNFELWGRWKDTQKISDFYETLMNAFKEIAGSKQQRLDALNDDEKKVKVEN